MHRLGFFHYYFFHPLTGSRGGLSFSWRQAFDVEVISIKENVISLLVYLNPSHTPWLLSVVYGPTLWHQKAAFWTLLHSVAGAFGGPWLCLGDFNCLLASWEKHGGLPFASSSHYPLQHLMDAFGLIDLGFKGQAFAWSNNRDGWANIKERLDRAIANADWQSLFSKCCVTLLLRASSDHAPLLLESDGEVFSYPKPFRFESFWAKDASCGQVISTSWALVCQGSPAFKLCSKVKEVKRALKYWNRTHFGLVKERLKALSAQIQLVQDFPPSPDNLATERRLVAALCVEEKIEEEMWCVKSRKIWLTTRYLDTKFFHLSTMIRRHRNAIEFFKDGNGSWLSSRSLVRTHILDYFQSLFASS